MRRVSTARPHPADSGHLPCRAGSSGCGAVAGGGQRLMVHMRRPLLGRAVRHGASSTRRASPACAESRLRRVPLAPSTAYPTYGAEGHTRRYAYRRDLLKEPSWLLLLGVFYRECVRADSPRPFCACIHAPTHAHAHPFASACGRCGGGAFGRGVALRRCAAAGRLRAAGAGHAAAHCNGRRWTGARRQPMHGCIGIPI